MCGIAVSFASENRAEPLRLQSLQHRGPDGSGEWRSADGSVWFGHTRLAILDLSPAGAQPMPDPQTGNVIVFNGEIYNHRALRRELPRADADWRGTSDTETLLESYRVWGPDSLRRLKGMFALAVYDAKRRGLFLARDRLGIKPLYYASNGSCFFAASEVRALPIAVTPRIDGHRIGEYLQWGACPENCLLFPGIRVLPAGHSMFVSSEGKCSISRYWPSPRPFRSATEDATREVRRLVETSVEEHLLADVPVASFLSGGIDSAVITAVAARKSGGRLRTFAVGFKESAYDETNIAREVADKYRTEHQRIELDENETVQIVQEAVEKLDVPSVDALNTYIVARKVAEHGIKVALSGLGGDELFGGYPSFSEVPKLKWLSRLPSAIRHWFEPFGAMGRRLADLPPDADAACITLWRRRFWTDVMLAQANLPVFPLSCDAAPDLPDDFARISWVELTQYMRHMLLRDSDQMSMAVSIELRVPFLDHELVEFVLGLPAYEKTRGKTAKGLLVAAFRDLLPPCVYNRPKKGFALPMDDWMRGPLECFVRRGLDEVTDLKLLPEEAIQGVKAQFQARALHWTRIWSLVVLGHYMRRHSATGSE
jgi:asparagine synthase (glutamine-hydrolysing)